MGKQSRESNERWNLMSRILELEPIRAEDEITVEEAIQKMKGESTDRLREVCRSLERTHRQRAA